MSRMTFGLVVLIMVAGTGLAAVEMGKLVWITQK